MKSYCVSIPLVTWYDAFVDAETDEEAIAKGMAEFREIKHDMNKITEKCDLEIDEETEILVNEVL
ncbi:MAG TPA: hypothetical protein VJY42_02020 [Candidatus Methanomethylophilaceae archaeon]|nr:hypothetical protein [Candidatus Methanomethylophilaceae archaeon]